jgi:hypothetical protein
MAVTAPVPTTPPDDDGEARRIASLMQEIDACALDENWTGVAEVRDRCVAAVQRGHQWWPAAAWAEYHMAMSGPAEVAASVLGSHLERFTAGPFAEIAACNHAWVSISPFLDDSPIARLFADECVARGDDLRADDSTERGVVESLFGLPLVLASWEPRSPDLYYGLDGVHDDPPVLPEPLLLSALGPSVDTASDMQWINDDTTLGALRNIVEPWSTAGRSCKAMAADSAPRTVIAKLHPGAPSGLVELDSSTALQWMRWIGASGGPSGRRRGSAAARSQIWWLLASVLDVEPDPELNVNLAAEIHEGLQDLQWFRWSPDVRRPATGWDIHVAIFSPHESITWVLQA